MAPYLLLASLWVAHIYRERAFGGADPHEVGFGGRGPPGPILTPGSAGLASCQPGMSTPANIPLDNLHSTLYTNTRWVSSRKCDSEGILCKIFLRVGN